MSHILKKAKKRVDLKRMTYNVIKKGVVMKTTVLMKRELFGKEILQNSKNEYFSATDLIRAGNLWRREKGLEDFNFSKWLQSKGAKEFISELEKEYGEVKINSKGKGQHTWVHPFLFIDIALSISPELKISVYSWITDNLLKYRNDSGDSYKKMSGALYLSMSNKSEFKNTLIEFAQRIKNECGVISWETASEEQLKLRDRIHENISLLSDILREKNNLLDISIKKAREIK
jgi:hypothetical protein